MSNELDDSLGKRGAALIRKLVVAAETARKLWYSEHAVLLLEDAVKQTIEEFPELRDYAEWMTNQLVEPWTVHGGPQVGPSMKAKVTRSYTVPVSPVLDE